MYVLIIDGDADIDIVTFISETIDPENQVKFFLN
jgi:hypothetical protein